MDAPAEPGAAPPQMHVVEPGIAPPVADAAPDVPNLGSDTWWSSFNLTVFGKTISNEFARQLIYGLTAVATISVVAVVVMAASDSPEPPDTSAIPAPVPSVSEPTPSISGPRPPPPPAQPRQPAPRPAPTPAPGNLGTTDIVQGYAHMRYLGEDWYLVRRDAGSADPDGDTCWHPAEDNLRGVDIYGENDQNPTGTHTFSLSFSDLPWTQMLLGSGDMSMFAVLARDDLEQCSLSGVTPSENCCSGTCCGVHGTCDIELGQRTGHLCTCNDGFTGESCEIGVDGPWYPTFLHTSEEVLGCEDDPTWADERYGQGCDAYSSLGISHDYCGSDRGSGSDGLLVLAQEACRSACNSCAGSGTASKQYCRAAQPEDPWISVGEHPDRIVYGEGGWCGRHWNDDSPTAGGSNVWVNNVGSSDGTVARAPPFDVVTSPTGERLVHMAFAGQDWYLVRRDPGDLNTGGASCSGYDPSCWVNPTDVSSADNCWHPTDDNLAGTAHYGEYEYDPEGMRTFSIPFSRYAWDQILLASGDMSMYVVMTRESIQTCIDSPTADGVRWEVELEESSESDDFEINQYCRAGSPSDPWISVSAGSEADRAANAAADDYGHPDRVVYGEGWCGGHWDDAPKHGGSNVWVNSLTPAMNDVQDGFARFNFAGEDWFLIRRDAGSQDATGEECWHPANDQLAGTEGRYGQNDANPLGVETFNVPFANYAYDKMLLASGDMSMYVVMDRDVVEQCSSGAVDGPWHPVISQTSASRTQTSVLQYCRQGNSEDPWISVGEHPDRIVYGEGGWCGFHWADDSPAAGGSNVWINSIDCLPGLSCDANGPARFDVVPLGDPAGTNVASMQFAGRTWYLVRRDPGELSTGGKTCSGYDPSCWDTSGDNCWHQATDNLAGTDSYGECDADPMGLNAYSIPFAQTSWNNMLLASGDLSMYVVMERAAIEECSQGRNDGQWFPSIVEASDATESAATQYCRSGSPEDPWISVGHHPDKVVYGEGWCGAHWSDDAPVQGGMNVWVDSITATDFVVEPTSGQEIAHISMLGEDWYLVRRDAGAMDRDGERCWHPANDQLAGTESYGVNDASPTGPETFTIRFDVFEWDKMLLASGDLSMYVEMDRSVIEQCTNGEVNGQWRPNVLASSTRQDNVLQYCRAAQPEDPWISAADHPDEIVYGEGGWCGHHWDDDAPAFGGSNVWVNSIELAAGVTSIPVGEPFDVFPLADGTDVARMDFAGRKWYLVRRDPGELSTGGKTCSGYDPSCWDTSGDNCWHQATDNLAGTDSYGECDADPMGLNAYSIPFAHMDWTEMLLSSGDMTMFAVLTRTSIEECSQGRNDGQWFPEVTLSSESAGYSVTQYCRSGAPEDPWISVGHHPDRVVYGEGWCGAHWSDDAPVQGGMNVWVNNMITVDTVVGTDGNNYAHFNYNDDEWYLVRRDAGSLDATGDQCWHPADDQLRGTAEYGENDADPLGIHTFSIRFEHLNWNRLLFSSGDMSLWLVITRSEMETCSIDRMQNHAGGSTWYPDVISSSLQGGLFETYQVTQYCREGVVEDPWISVGEHPDRIVYGEGGWCGGHWGDDAPTLGGSNVWVDSIECADPSDCGPVPPPFQVEQGPNGESFITQRFDGRTWYLVRRDAGELNTGGKTCDGYDPSCWDTSGDNCWHPTDDNLAGTDQYGSYDTSSPMSPSTFSVQFANFAWSEMLLASGDLSMYVVMDRSSVEECSASDHSGHTGTTGTNANQWRPHITTSSEADEYDVIQYCRAGRLIVDCSAGGCQGGRVEGSGREGNAEDPWISVGHHQDNKIVYGEGMCGRHWSQDAPVHGGMNVWVDSLDALAQVSTTATVAAATMTADSGDENRDSGDMANIMAAVNGGDHFVRYRTGGGPGYLIDLALDAAYTVTSISTLVHTRDGGSSGFAGLEVLVSTDNGVSYTSVYQRQRIFGTFERNARCFDGSADCETPAPDFIFDRWTVHAFQSPVRGVTNVRLHTGYADQDGDACFSLNSIRVDTPPSSTTTSSSDYVPVVAARWYSDAGTGDNRDSGDMADINSAIHPRNNFVRYRTGSAEDYTVELQLASPSDISGVSLLVNQHEQAAGYSGIEVFVSTDNGASFTSSPVYWREEMFGSFERGAQYSTPAPDFTFGEWTIHAFSEVQHGITNLRLHFGHADQSSDSAVSFDCIRVDPAGAYAAGAVEGSEPPSVAVDASCAPVRDGPLDFFDLSGILFSCQEGVQSYVVEEGATSVNVWLSGGGGGFGSQAHPPNTGAAAGLAYGTLSVSPGERLRVYVGCAGESGNGAQGIGGGGGGGSAVLNQNGDVLLVAGGAGGQAGAWDAGRQVEGEIASTHGGHGGGSTGEDGGTTPCNGDALGGGGASSDAPGSGGTSNRGYDVGEPGSSPSRTRGGNGGDGGGQGGDQTCAARGGWGWGSGGCGRAVFGDGGGGGGGGGYYGGGGGGGACHGTGGGGGSGYKRGNGYLLGGRGVPEGQDGWAVITAEPCDELSSDPPELAQAGGWAAVSSATWFSDGGESGGHAWDTGPVLDGNNDNRDTGAMADISSAIWPQSQFVRYRTGSAEGYTVILQLEQQSDLSGVSIMVNANTDFSVGYSGIEIFLSVDNGATYTREPVYWRQEMFGSYDRGALFTTPASDFAFDQWTIHAFSEVQIGVTNVQLHFGHADQAGDSAVSFNSIRIDLSNSYAVGGVEGQEPIVSVSPVDETCAPIEEGPFDFESLGGFEFNCLGATQSWTVPDEVRIAHVWMSGGGGGFGSQAHPPNTGAAAGLTYAELAVIPGDRLSIYVGCAGESGQESQGKGGGGGGGSAVLNQNGDVLLVAGGAGGQAGAWDAGRQVEGEIASTHGGHGGGSTGEDGGTTPCNGDALGGGGASSDAPGSGGTSNRGYDVGEPGSSPSGTRAGNGGDGGGQGGDQTCAARGGWGWGSGGCGRDVPGDGGGGGGGGGYYGGGGGGGACHGTGGGGGSGYVADLRGVATVSGSTGQNFGLLGGRGVPEGEDGWVVITTGACGTETGSTVEAGSVQVTSASMAADNGDANRDQDMDPMNSIAPLDNFMRYRVGDYTGFTMDLTIEPSDVEGVSILVHSGESDSVGYSGIEISTSADRGASYTMVYSRYLMFGQFDRSASYELEAPAFVYDEWTVHAFSAVAYGVTNVRLHFGAADQASDACVSMHSLRVDAAGSYRLSTEAGITEPPQLGGWCLPEDETEPVNFEVLIDAHNPDAQQLFECTETEVSYRVPPGVEMVNVWMSGGGGGFGSRPHAPMTGAAAGLAYGTLQVTAGETLRVFVGCAGQDGCLNSDCGEREGGGGGGGSAVLRGDTALLVAGGAGGQAGGDDNSLTAGGHGGGASGETGGTTECNDYTPGGLGGTQDVPGRGGASNRGYGNGEDGSGHDGGHGGGTGDNHLASQGGWGYGVGGSGRTVGGDGGGGGGGGGWRGGGGGGGGCHGMGGGGGSGHVSNDPSVEFGQTVSGRGVPESADGWVIITTENPTCEGASPRGR